MDSPTNDNDRIHVEQFELFARVGVTENERATPQRLTLNVTVWPRERFDNLQDDITKTINYSAICVVARNYAAERPVRLIETLASGLAAKFLQDFEIGKVHLELRKFVLPDAQYAAVMVTRTARN